MTPLQERNLDILHQLTGLLECLPTPVYAEPLALLHGHSVGQHVRHVVEFYQCLLAQPAGAAVVNYDTRPRDLRLETDPQAACEALSSAARLLRGHQDDAPLLLEDGEGGRQQSSFFRELSYLIEHSVHHMAIVKIALNAEFPAFDIPETFGVAHSTLRYRSQLAVGR